MKFMRLPPDVVRLRRIARAHMAGECSQEEYRTLRREVLDNFRRGRPDDNTARRDGWDDTLRATEHYHALGEKTVDSPSADAGRFWLVAVVGLALAVAVLGFV